MVTLHTLAEFKRFLATPGATVQIIQNDWSDPAKTIHPITPTSGYWDPKQIAKVQAQTVKFTSGGWLQFPKAAHVRCEHDTVTICMNQDGSFRHVLVYKCWIADAEQAVR